MENKIEIFENISLKKKNNELKKQNKDLEKKIAVLEEKNKTLKTENKIRQAYLDQTGINDNERVAEILQLEESLKEERRLSAIRQEKFVEVRTKLKKFMQFWVES
jgi:regulator of replication initiation timing